MLSHQSHIDHLSTWIKYSAKLCRTCHASCCTLPVEVQPVDLVRMGLIDAFELEEDPKLIARQLKKKGIIEHYSQKTGKFTLTRMASGDCLYLDTVSRRCTIYQQRPDTCRNHPRIGPRSGYCAYSPKNR